MDARERGWEWGALKVDEQHRSEQGNQAAVACTLEAVASAPSGARRTLRLEGVHKDRPYVAYGGRACSLEVEVAYLAS